MTEVGDDTDIENDDEFLEYSDVKFDDSVSDARTRGSDINKATNDPHTSLKSCQCRSLCAMTYRAERERKMKQNQHQSISRSRIEVTPSPSLQELRLDKSRTLSPFSF